MDIAKLKKKLSSVQFEVADQAFRFECTSLRPYTRFYVIMDKVDYTPLCVQDGKGLAEPLISDGYGKLNFTFYWNRSNEEAMHANPQFKKYFDMSSGNKILLITDKSATSFVYKTIFFNSNSPDLMFSIYTNASNITLT